MEDILAGLESLEDGPTEAHTASEADHNPAEDVCALVRGVEARLAERLDALMLACAPAAAASTAAGVLSAAAVAAEAPAPLSDDAIAALDEGALRAELRARDEALAKLVRVVMPLARAVRHQQKAGPASKDSGKGRQRSSARSLDDATPTPSSARGSLDALPDSPAPAPLEMTLESPQGTLLHTPPSTSKPGSSDAWSPYFARSTRTGSLLRGYILSTHRP